jgi:hypothetical protein
MSKSNPLLKYAGIFLVAILLLSTNAYAFVPQIKLRCNPNSDIMTFVCGLERGALRLFGLNLTTNTTINMTTVTYTTINYTTTNYSTINTTTTINYTTANSITNSFTLNTTTTSIPTITASNTTQTRNPYITNLIGYLLGSFFKTSSGIRLAPNLTNRTTAKTCTNGALNSSWPYCDSCPENYVYNGTTQKCEGTDYCTGGNGVAAYTNFPWCNNFCPPGSPQYSLYPDCTKNTTAQTCTNGATDYPTCDRNDTAQICLNGGIDYPNCYVGGVSCSVEPENPDCVCTNGATPGNGNGNCAVNVNTQTCIYGGIYPNCSLCPPGQENIALAPDIDCEVIPICGGLIQSNCTLNCVPGFVQKIGSYGCQCPQGQSEVTDPETGSLTCQGSCGNNALNSSFPYCNKCPEGQTYDVETYMCENIQTCQYGGTWPDDCLPCPVGYSYNVSSSKCEFASTCPYGGSYPDCNKCPPGYNYNTTSDTCQGSCQYGGTFPNCNLCKPGYAINPDTGLCAAAVCDYGGTFPNCNAAPISNSSCTNGATDADCTRNDSTKTCVNGYSNYPYCADCTTSSADYPSCLSNKESCDYGGTFPDCNISPETNTTAPTTPTETCNDGNPAPSTGCVACTNGSTASSLDNCPTTTTISSSGGGGGPYGSNPCDYDDFGCVDDQ